MEPDDQTAAANAAPAAATLLTAAAAAPSAGAATRTSAPAELTAMLVTARRLQAEREAAAAPLVDLSPSLFAEGHTPLFALLFACQCGQQPAHVLQLPVELSCACAVSGRCLLHWLGLRGGASGHGSARPAGSAGSAASSSNCPCPGCGEDIAADVRAWQTNRHASRQLARQIASCVNRAVGCGWSGAFGADGDGLHDHLDKCAFSKKPCGHCSKLVIRADMNEHLATRCTKHMRH